MALPGTNIQLDQTHGQSGTREYDFISLGIAATAIILFVGVGGLVLPATISALFGEGLAPNQLLVNALLLNIALILLGWRRYRDLTNEIDTRRTSENEARLLADTDPLTGTLNRLSFNKAVDRLIDTASDTKINIAIMMIDLDNFKHLNDLMGHSAGDQILIEAADRLMQNLPEGSLLARIGGDEFVCCIPFDASHPEIIDKIAAAMLKAISGPSDKLPNGTDISASIGITRLDVLQRTSAEVINALRLLEMADVAMYHAKRNGRNSYFWFESYMADEMQFRSQLAAGIRKGLENAEFVPFYEQQIDVQSSHITGFEMLARWNSPEFGMVKPDVFIPIAEDVGLISQLSEQLIAKALEDAKEWDSSLTLAVNISPVQLRDPWFAQKLLKLLIEANFPPNRLEIEITESCIHEDIAQVRTLIASLKNQGIRVSLDDFGTGYSSLAQLRALPFDRIKIDRSFVSNLAESEDSAAIVKSIALLGQGLGLPITAEGIETNEIREKLRRFDKMKGQGYLYGQPQSAQDTLSFLKEKGLLNAFPQPESAPTVSLSQDDPAADPLRANGK